LHRYCGACRNVGDCAMVRMAPQPLLWWPRSIPSLRASVASTTQANTTNMRASPAVLAALFDRLGRYEPAATIAGSSLSAFSAPGGARPAARRFPSARAGNIRTEVCHEQSKLCRQSRSPPLCGNRQYIDSGSTSFDVVLNTSTRPLERLAKTQTAFATVANIRRVSVTRGAYAWDTAIDWIVTAPETARPRRRRHPRSCSGTGEYLPPSKKHCPQQAGQGRSPCRTTSRSCSLIGQRVAKRDVTPPISERIRSRKTAASQGQNPSGTELCHPPTKPGAARAPAHRSRYTDKCTVQRVLVILLIFWFNFFFIFFFFKASSNGKTLWKLR